MQNRSLGRTGFSISTVSFGCWAIGGTWGPVNDKESMAALHRACDLGVNFYDTADVYGDGHSEKLVGQLIKERSEKIYVATKAGRRLTPHERGGYTKKNLTSFIERSLKNLGIEAVDLLQLHCPPTDVYYMPEVFDALDELTSAGKIKNYGVSIERVEEGLKAIEFENVKTLQLIYNVFRQRAADSLFAACIKKQVGVLARVPLASGLLSGKMNVDTLFAEDDHRNFNRKGEAFDVGETFAGLPYELGLECIEELRPLVPKDMEMATWALRFVLMEQAVSCVIPGARTVHQVEANVQASEAPPLTDGSIDRIRSLYEGRIKPLVHHRW